METINSHKILGIILDRKLNFNKHVKLLSDKCKKQTNMLKAFTQKKNGAQQKKINATVKSKMSSRIA